MQLPPSLQLEPGVARDFFGRLRERTKVDVVCEPRHATWSTPEAQRLLAEARVGVVRADPQVVPELPVQGEVAYYRLHGSPKIYHSEYSEPYLDALASELAAHRRRAAAPGASSTTPRASRRCPTRSRSCVASAKGRPGADGPDAP